MLRRRQSLPSTPSWWMGYCRRGAAGARPLFEGVGRIGEEESQAPDNAKELISLCVACRYAETCHYLWGPQSPHDRSDSVRHAAEHSPKRTRLAFPGSLAVPPLLSRLG